MSVDSVGVVCVSSSWVLVVWGNRGSKIRYPQLDVLSDGAAHGAEHLVHLVQDCCGDIVAEVVEAGANLCDLVLVAWALRMVLPWCRGAVAKGAEGGAGEASCMSDPKFVCYVGFNV